ncbi:ABC transporter permease [Brucellaceae bacterium D45D]
MRKIGFAGVLNPLLPVLEAMLIPLLALVGGGVLFSIFLLAQDKSPVQFFSLIWQAGFSSAFSWQNTLSRVSPLIFAALCVALPARLGLMVIGGEGALVFGGLAAGITGAALAGVLPSGFVIFAMVLAAAICGAFWIGLAGLLRVKRQVNETIASLLLSYIALALFNFFVEGPFRDPASLNKPSTAPLQEALRVGSIPFLKDDWGLKVHWGVAFGILVCVLCWFLLERTTIGFAARVTGDNVRAAQTQGLPVTRIVITFTALAGALVGIGGYFEVAAIHGSANGALISGVGYTGILVAFLARHNPLAIIPVAILIGGIEASSGLIQRRMALPDATILVFEGCVFLLVLMAETLYGRSPELLRRMMVSNGAAS